MIDWLEQIDRQIVLSINSLHTPFFDNLMWLLSSRLLWIPFYILLLAIVYRKKRLLPTLFFLAGALLLVFIVDFLSVHAFKEVFQRYRPSHNLQLTDKLHFYQDSNGQEYKGGQFGFISSHASNFAAITTFFVLYIREIKWKWAFYIPMIMVGISRIYLGVHYLSDIIVGFLFGGIMAYIIFKFAFVHLNDKLKFQ